MKYHKRPYKISVTITYFVKEVGDVIFTVYGTYEDQGIGHYEFWGAPGFNSNYVEVWDGDVVWNDKDFNEEENTEIKKFVDVVMKDDGESEKFYQQCDENHEYEEPGY